MYSKTKIISLLAVLTMLTGCGGGGSESSSVSATNTTPLANSAETSSITSTELPKLVEVQTSEPIITENSATIEWLDNNYTAEKIDYGTSKNYGLELIIETEVTINYKKSGSKSVVVLSNLEADTTYNYRIVGKDTYGKKVVSKNKTFMTSGPTLEPEPAPTEPAPTEPAPTEPIVTEPAPTEPIVTEPTPELEPKPEPIVDVEIIVDNLDSRFTTSGSWSESIASDEYAESSLFSMTPSSSATWTPALQNAGSYAVYVWYTGSDAQNRNTSADYTVNHAGGSETIVINQNQGSGEWVMLGLFSFNAGSSSNVTLKHDGESGVSVADAVKFVLVQDPEPAPIEPIVTEPILEPLVSKVTSTQEVSSFLSKATFGATSEAIEDLVTKGNYDQWFEAEFAKTPSYHIAWAERNAIGINGIGDLKDNPEDWRSYSDGLTYLQRDAWWDIVVNGDDQLRQRVAFALSEIMTISRFGPLINNPDSRMSYYDVLVKNAFSNFKTLLQEITYHPAMGKYLSYLGNSKADPEKGSRPDENYAREVMQLFTIGLYQLNLDGSKKLDANGVALPTYTQTDIEEMSRVFTGLTNQNGYFKAGDGGSTHTSRTAPMIAYDQYHDSDEKVIMGQTISGGDTKTDINQALNILFNHPNTGPFIAKRLIQRLVTSNPSPSYIARVALAFNDNGKGVRGDMKAVIKAILLDKEAFNRNIQTSGKVREPLLFVSHLFRAFHAQNDVNILKQGSKALYQYRSYYYRGTNYTMQEAPLEALTVFNFFTPDDAPYSLKKEGLVAPEFKVFSKGLHQLLMGLINKDGFIYRYYNITAELQLATEKSLLEAKKYDELLDHLDTLLVAGNMSDHTKSAIKSYIVEHKNLESDILARYVIGLIMTSPDYAVQR